jgi:hypothetical protein
MAKVLSTLLVLVVACLVVVSMASAQDKKGKGQRPDPGARFDAMEKSAGHDPLTGCLTKDEFVKAMKESGSKMADRAPEFFDKIKKADANKVTKDEYIAGIKELFSGGKKKGG